MEAQSAEERESTSDTHRGSGDHGAEGQQREQPQDSSGSDSDTELLRNMASMVSLRLFTNGAKVLELVFNGTGSSVTSWMSPSRILQSPWNDLSTSSSAYNFFSIAPQIPYKRFFFIKFYKGCDGDTGWLCASDTMGTRVPCPWEGSSFPSFVYSTASGATLWQGTKVKNADVFAIFVQF
ncbi:hypothetical protein ACOMHN_028120 [Nucella lapillus]